MANIQPYGGLCSRLRAMLGWRDAHGSVTVSWFIRGECPGRFLDVFEPLPDAEFVKDFQSVRTNKPFADILGDKYTLAREVAAYGELVPVLSIRLRLHALVAMGLRDWKGCHIRRTDHPERHAVPEQEYREWAGESPVFLATDCPDVQNRWPKAKKAATLNRPGLRKSTLNDAVADLFALALCKEFMGSPGSTFTDAVMILRELPVEVKVRWLAEGSDAVGSRAAVTKRKPDAARRGLCVHLGKRTEFRDGCGGSRCKHECNAGEPFAVPAEVCQTCKKWEPQ